MCIPPALTTATYVLYVVLVPQLAPCYMQHRNFRENISSAIYIQNRKAIKVATATVYDLQQVRYYISDIS